MKEVDVRDDLKITVEGEDCTAYKFDGKGNLVWVCGRAGGCSHKAKTPRNQVMAGGMDPTYGTEYHRVETKVEEVKRKERNLKGAKDASDRVAAYIADLRGRQTSSEFSAIDSIETELLEFCSVCGYKYRFRVTVEVDPQLLEGWEPWDLEPIEAFTEKYKLDRKGERTLLALGRLREKYHGLEAPVKLYEKLKARIPLINDAFQPILDDIDAALKAIPEADPILTPMEKTAKIAVGRVRELLIYRMRSILYEIYGNIESPPVTKMITPVEFAAPSWARPEPRVNPLQGKVSELEGRLALTSRRVVDLTRQRDDLIKTTQKLRKGR